MGKKDHFFEARRVLGGTWRAGLFGKPVPHAKVVITRIRVNYKLGRVSLSVRDAILRPALGLTIGLTTCIDPLTPIIPFPLRGTWADLAWFFKPGQFINSTPSTRHLATANLRTGPVYAIYPLRKGLL